MIQSIEQQKIKAQNKIRLGYLATTPKNLTYAASTLRILLECEARAHLFLFDGTHGSFRINDDYTTNFRLYATYEMTASNRVLKEKKKRFNSIKERFYNDGKTPKLFIEKVISSKILGEKEFYLENFIFLKSYVPFFTRMSEAYFFNSFHECYIKFKDTIDEYTISNSVHEEIDERHYFNEKLGDISEILTKLHED